ncbi:MAG TPA: hypothetical protein VGF13_11940 [Verrucomicrobiae bacterium]|jgi:hypothetical protein
MNPVIKKIRDFEYEIEDPVTTGTWRIVCGHPLSDFGVMKAIEIILLEQDIRPGKGTTLTVEFSISKAKKS